MVVSLLLSMVLAAGAPAPSSSSEADETAETASPTTAAKTRADPGRLVCRRESKPNSRFTTKTCKTLEEWDERSTTAQDAFEDVRGRPMIKIDPPTGTGDT